MVEIATIIGVILVYWVGFGLLAGYNVKITLKTLVVELYRLIIPFYLVWIVVPVLFLLLVKGLIG